VYVSAGDRQNAGRWLSTSASGLAPAIRRIREEQKINQEEAAERCGLHRTYYSGIERGLMNVSLVNIEKVAKGLRKSLLELFSRV
jgi:transcriptional regulator with XRE-family HTH domain